MLSLIQKPLDRLAERARYWPIFYRKYNNVLGYTLNERFGSYARKCQAAYRQKTGEQLDPHASELRKEGTMLVRNAFSREDALAISDEFSRRAQQDDGVIHGKNDALQVGLAKPVSTLNLKPLDVFKNPDVDRELRQYFGGYYRIMFTNSYRSFPTDKIEESWLWHTDSYPIYTCKLFLFCTDAGKDQGATQFMSREDTMQYRAAGYFGNITKDRLSDLEPFAKEHGLPYRPFQHEAAAGDVMLFENNGLHRAVPPKAGFRDVIAFGLLPSMRPWDEQLKLDGIEKIEKATHFPKDPNKEDSPTAAGGMM